MSTLLRRGLLHRPCQPQELLAQGDARRRACSACVQRQQQSFLHTNVPARHSTVAGAAGQASATAVREVPEGVRSKLGADLHLRPGHPLQIIKRTIEMHFEQEALSHGSEPFMFFDSLSPEVSVEANFDELLIPPDHVSRAPTDTFYLDDRTVLRTHTSAHQNELMRSGHKAFLCTGDVYRRDTVDRSHYPVFHQTEGLKFFEEWGNEQDACDKVEEDMKRTLDGLARALFGDVETRWSPDYFPFTEPSWELEILFQGEWLEVLGCGVVHQQILTNCGLEHGRGWAFGLGLERLAMILFNVPDIRLFWTDDPRFHSQFLSAIPGDHATFPSFVPYSRYPECYKDVSFWLPEERADGHDIGKAAVFDTTDDIIGVPPYHENLLHEVVREVGGDLVEEAVLTDAFTHPKTGRTSHCYRINYRATDRSLTNQEVDEMQFRLRDLLAERLGLEVR